MAILKEDLLIEEKLAAAERSRSRHFIRLGPAGMPKPRSNRARWERRRKICQAMLTVVAAGIAVGGAVLLQRAVLANEDFVVRDVECRTDGALSDEEILKAAGPLEGRHILQVNIDAVGSALRRQPLVEQATVERRFPASVTISLRERRPAVWLIYPARGAEARDVGGVLLDRGGTAVRCDVLRPEYLRLPAIEFTPQPLGQEAVNRTEELPALVSGEKIEDAEILAAIELHTVLDPVCKNHSLQVARYRVDRHYSLDAIFAGGLEVRFPVEVGSKEPLKTFGERVKLFEETLRHYSAAGRIPAFIDLTLADVVAVRDVVPRAQVVPDEPVPGAAVEEEAEEEIYEFVPDALPESSEDLISQP